MARGLAGLLARLEVAPQLVVGHSAGAAVALQMLLDRSIAPRRIVGLGSALLPLPGTTRQILAPAASLLAGSRVAGLVASLAGRRPTVERLLASTGSRLDPEGVRHYQRLAAQREHVAGVLSMMACWNLEPLFARLPEIRQDVLLLAGREDRSVPVAQQRRAASRIPGARLVVVPDAGHLLHEERPQQVAELMVRDLTETPERHPS
jgi:magnesium chelatase accessory protein